MTRSFWVWLHRWAGLIMAGFLLVVGVTGSLLAFMPEMNQLLAPDIHPGPHAGKELGLGALAKRAEAIAPEARAKAVSYERTGSARVTMEPRPLPLVPDYSQVYFDPIAGEEYAVAKKTEPPPALGYDYLYLDPVAGKELGRLDKEPPLTTGAGIMPFVLQLHYKLAMGEWGGWILGIVALVWTLDCFVGGYLTLPASTGKTNKKSYLERWKPSWLVKLRGSFYRVNFDLHRAFGLWMFAVLLLFAWSSVYFNMKQIYTPAMQSVFDYEPGESMMAMGKKGGGGKSSRGGVKAAMDWEKAQSVGEKLMLEQALANNFTVDRPIRLAYQGPQGVYAYAVHSSRDVGDASGKTTVNFDASTGEFRSLRAPTGEHAGNTITTWLVEMHMANIFGLPFRIFVCVLGLGIGMLCVTGVYIWWKKRAARLASTSSHASSGARVRTPAPAPALAFRALFTKALFTKPD